MSEIEVSGGLIEMEGTQFAEYVGGAGCGSLLYLADVAFCTWTGQMLLPCLRDSEFGMTYTLSRVLGTRTAGQSSRNVSNFSP